MSGRKHLRREVPVCPPASIGIGLCDPEQVLTADQRRALASDLESLAQARRRDEANARGVVIR